ncbi:hypothetical protein DV096_11975 [Bradymonadaceae bacterium TMQ3]|nr:hypothetical protein DV096_11975 [Bradymonadaceae bacterium TMQ3]TXC75390.1 hypothetical protein FRC91_11785 [Bradymonadales bacterium TMQ1]
MPPLHKPHLRGHSPPAPLQPRWNHQQHPPLIASPAPHSPSQRQRLARLTHPHSVGQHHPAKSLDHLHPPGHRLLLLTREEPFSASPVNASPFMISGDSLSSDSLSGDSVSGDSVSGDSVPPADQRRGQPATYPHHHATSRTTAHASPQR